MPFLRDVAATAGAAGLAARLDEGPVRLALALVILGAFVYLNLRGGAVYEWTLVPLMVLMFVLGGVVIVAGLAFDHEQFAAAALLRDGRAGAAGGEPALPVGHLLRRGQRPLRQLHRLRRHRPGRRGGAEPADGTFPSRS